MQSRVHPLSSAQAIEVPHKIAATIRRIARKKMRSDVSSSCWKRLQWETAQSWLHSGAALIPVWSTLPAMTHKEDGMTFSFPAADLRIKYDREHFQQIMTSHPLPRRWPLRHNDRLRLLCDASKFIAALARLHQPERGGFLTFSRPQAA